MNKQTLKKWASGNKSNSKGNNRNWIHTPEALQSGHIAYLVKFLGKTDASQPKGIDVVKESIQKLKFSNQLKLSEGTKIPKVELTVSVDGVAIQDPKTKQVSYQYPLHRISYCADDKSDKKLFCFIAKEPNSDNHSSFVFASDKLAEEITLTIGQAFDLAYRRFLESSGKELEMRKRMMMLQKRVQELEAENKKLSQQLACLQKNKEVNESKIVKNDNVLGVKNGIQTKDVPPPLQPPPPFHRHRQQDLLGDFDEPKEKGKYNEFLNDVKELENAYNGNTQYSNTLSNLSFQCGKYDLNLQSNAENDPFGMGNFSSASLQDQAFQNAFGEVDQKLLEMRDGFKRGLSFGNDDFSSDYLEAVAK